MVGDKAGTKCVDISETIECTGEKKIYAADGKSCVDCDPKTRAMKRNTVCESDTCQAEEVLDNNGRCQAEGFKDCTSRQFLDKTRNQFTQCADYSAPNASKTSCASPICTNAQILTVEGICSNCPYG